jgi:5-methylcytosine-specific restriction endonuclease McrA
MSLARNPWRGFIIWTIPHMPGWHSTSRHARGYGAAWVKLRDAIMRRDNYLCQCCLKQGRATPATECDHITPKHKGGTDDEDNLQALCKPCHTDKTAIETAESQGRNAPRSAYDKSGNLIWQRG